MIARVFAAQLCGLKADLIEVEADISRGTHAFSIVGLPDKSIDEAKDRLNAAIKNSGFQTPLKGSRRTIISLAPADIRKEGTGFDLAIALAYLLGTGEIKFSSAKKLFLGELALDGSLRPIKGVLFLVKKARELGFTEVYLPRDNAREAALIQGIKIYGCKNLRQLIEHLSPAQPTEEKEIKTELITPEEQTLVITENYLPEVDLCDIAGQDNAKRGLEIAAAGGHNIAFYGPPGTGKTLLAKALAGIMPHLDVETAIEVTGIHSAAGRLSEEIITRPPFRSPHHTASYVSVIGGGAWPKPGEATLAHRGVLFLDEFPEFDRRVIESLRQPLEDRVVSIARAKGSNIFPADFILIATLNPCPCGYHGSAHRACTCSAGDIVRYQRKISGPIMDRIDMWIEVPLIDYSRLTEKNTGREKSDTARQRIEAARSKQLKRLGEIGLTQNSQMGVKELNTICRLTDNCSNLLNESAKKLSLSPRSYHRTIKLARTIADLAGEKEITADHLYEALAYRPKMNIF